ncbi:hypothetical protein AHF37_05118 [Paragonimus kellicotti]|nr:hypothetical protein AHF37_05118 [Paragonimus kellicotti]
MGEFGMLPKLRNQPPTFIYCIKTVELMDVDQTVDSLPAPLNITWEKRLLAERRQGIKKTTSKRTEAMQLVRDAIAAGIFNDLGSGSFVDLCVITKDGAQYIRPYDIANKKGQRAGRYNAPAGSTATLSRTVQKVEFDVVTTRVIRDMPDPKEEAMDIA